VSRGHSPTNDSQAALLHALSLLFLLLLLLERLTMADGSSMGARRRVWQSEVKKAPKMFR